MNLNFERKLNRNNDNYIKITLKAKSGNEALARNIIAAFCVELNPTVDQINDIKTAVSEAVTNCIVHAYNNTGIGDIFISANIISDTIHIKVKDNGEGISDIKQAMQPFFTTKSHDERSGMGFTVMESYMDSVEVINDNGVVVSMTKKISSTPVSEGKYC